MLQHILGVQSELSVKALYGGASHYTEDLVTLERLGFDLVGLFPVTRDRRRVIAELDCLFVRTS